MKRRTERTFALVALTLSTTFGFGQSADAWGMRLAGNETRMALRVDGEGITACDRVKELEEEVAKLEKLVKELYSKWLDEILSDGNRAAEKKARDDYKKAKKELKEKKKELEDARKDCATAETEERAGLTEDVFQNALPALTTWNEWMNGAGELHMR